MVDRRSRTLNARQYAGLAYGLLVLTVYGSIIPLRFRPMSYEEALGRYREAGLYDATLVMARGDWVVNGMQYVVLSFCAAAALSVDLRWVYRLAAAAVVVPLGFLAASWIEFLQVYFPPRTISINDLIVERVGLVAGAVGLMVLGKAEARARRLAERVGIGHRWSHYPQQASGGEMQRAAIARALVHEPALLVADEPTGNLDSDNGQRVLTLLRELNRDLGVTILLATHAPDVAAAADGVLHMRDGRFDHALAPV